MYVDLAIALQGFFFWKVNGSMGQRVNGPNGSTGHISTVYVGGPRNCPWGVLFQKGQQVDDSTGQTGRRVKGSLSLSLYYIWQQTTPGSHHPAAKSTRRMMTPRSRHTTAKTTQHLLLARRVNFLVIQISLVWCSLVYISNHCLQPIY